MQELALKRGGRCLSTKYTNNSTKLTWQCKEGHTWESCPYQLLRGTWCPECYRLSKFLTIEEFQKIAASRNSKCLSDEYEGNDVGLRWQCEYTHIWEARPSSIKMGRWCPKCAVKLRGDKRRYSIKELQELARSKGGECISKEYLYSGEKLQWRCADGHTWWAPPYGIKSHWCSICAQGLSERVCRKTFEAIFKEQFQSRKPSWLQGLLGGRMELDGYCEKLELAFEYQGEQHYKQHELFHKDATFEERQQLDELKRRLCKEHNIVLIEVPYTVDYRKMFEWIINECLKHGVTIPETDWIDYTKLDAYSPKRLKELQEIAAKRGGECLSEAYLGANVKMKWKCSEGHIWETLPKVIKRGNWCATCSGRHQWKIEDMRKVAEAKSGKCLSEEYVDNTTKLRWQCKYGHQWESAPSNVLSGNWCSNCAGMMRLTIEDMRRLAETRGGKCLSDKYINTKTKLKWQCAKGHIWDAKPGNVKHSTWCPHCIGRHKTIEDMQAVAKERGGNFLSPKYLGSHKKHTWRCKEHHIWSATPHHILHGTWCPICYRMKR